VDQAAIKSDDDVGSVGGSSVGLALLESSGAANGTLVAMGNFCGEPAAVLLDALSADLLTILHGPTPFVVANLPLHPAAGFIAAADVVIAVVSPDISKLMILRASGLLQRVVVDTSCQAAQLTTVTTVTGSPVSLSETGDGGVIVLRNDPQHKHTPFVVLEASGKQTETDFGMECNGHWVAVSVLNAQLAAACQRMQGSVAVKLVSKGQQAAASWAGGVTANGTSTPVFIQPSSIHALPKLVGMHLMDVYGDGGVTVALVGQDTTVFVLDAWSGNSSLPLVGTPTQVSYSSFHPYKQPWR
jgi:hypothetical protein